MELACFRIVQEALTNVLRYAGASRVRVALATDGDMLALTVSDNGIVMTLISAERQS